MCQLLTVETGIPDLIIFGNTWQRYELVARHATALIAYGKLERKYEVIHVIVDRLEDMSTRLGEITHRSRNFR